MKCKFVACILLTAIAILYAFANNRTPVDNVIKFSESDYVNLDQSKLELGSFFNNQYYVGLDGVEKYLDAAKKCGIKVVTLYYNRSLSNSQTSLLNSLICKCNNLGIDVILSFNAVPDKKGDKTTTLTMNEWRSCIKEMVELYDGKHRLIVDEDGREGIPYVKYYTVMEEMDLFKGKYHLSTSDLLDLYDEAYILIKEQRPDAIVLSSLITKYSKDFFRELMTSTSDKGHNFGDTYDVFYVDTYGEPEAIPMEISQMKADIQKYLPKASNKPIWNCTGDSRWNKQDTYISNRIVRHALCTYSSGCSSYLNYKLVSYGGSLTSTPYSSYFGLFEPSVDNSFFSFMRNDGSNKPLSDGLAAEKVFVEYPPLQEKQHPGYIYLKVDSYDMRDRLRHHGLSLDGKRVSVLSVGISKSSNATNESVIYKEKYSMSVNGRLQLDKKLFSKLDKDDYIIVHYADANNPNVVGTVEYSEAAIKLKVLSGFLKDCNTQPILKTADNLYTVSWKTANNKFVYVIWSLKDGSVTIDNSRSLKAYNSKHSRIRFIKNEIQVNDDVVYVVCSKPKTFIYHK